MIETKATPEIAEAVENSLTERVIGAAIEVHRHLGPGLLESAYEECLCYELKQAGLRFQRQVHLPVTYKAVRLDCAYKLDVVVEDSVIVEIKAIEELLPIHKAQLLTYLKASNRRVGLLINFNVPALKNGLKRIVNRYSGPSPSEAEAPDALSDSSPRKSPYLRVSAMSKESTLSEEPAVNKEPA
jgi:GxxExxY protein